MRAKGLKGYQVAEALGKAPSTFSRWRSGDVNPTFEDLEELCRLLDVKAGELYDDPPSVAAKQAAEPPPDMDAALAEMKAAIRAHEARMREWKRKASTPKKPKTSGRKKS